MKNLLVPFFLLLLVATLSTSDRALLAQGMVDGFFQPRGQGSITLGYAKVRADEFYVADMKVGPIPAHNEITQDIFSLFANYGLTDDLTVVVSAPYIRAAGDGAADPFNSETSVSGLQDIQAVLKYRVVSVETGGGRFDGLVSLGGTIPTGYENNGILSLGSGATAADFGLGGHYHFDSGLFFTAVGSYSLRGEAENNFGVSPENVTAQDFDVPNALLGMAKVGYAGANFYAEGWIDTQQSLDGVDIMGPGFFGNFPETEVNYTRVGASVYVPFGRHLGGSISYSTLIDGRNISASNLIGAALTVGF